MKQKRKADFVYHSVYILEDFIHEQCIYTGLRHGVTLQ